jgi:hypothetical protein
MKATAMRKEKSNSPPMSNQVAWARRGYIWGYAMSDRTMLVFRGANYSVPKLTKRALHCIGPPATAGRAAKMS